MKYITINQEELFALNGLPFIQRVIYLTAIKPYADYKTGMVGISRKISYQAISEALYVEPHQGIQSGSPSRDQLRRAVKGLERAGLIAIQSNDKHLILKCLLANASYSVQNKAATNPPCDPATISTEAMQVNSRSSEGESKKAAIPKIAKAAIPHQSVNNNYVFLCQQFEKFWESYPQPQNKAHAWSEFEKLHPDEDLFSKILASLDAQISHYQQQQAIGVWVPHWKYPGNWLAQRCWEEESKANQIRRSTHATDERSSRKKLTDMFWESCKDGADYIPDDRACIESGDSKNNVVEFSQFRKTSKAY